MEISGPKKDKVCEQLMVSHNKELHDLHRILIINRRLRWIANVIQLEETRNAYKIFMKNAAALRLRKWEARH
jgi:hypothetical protein